MDRDHDTVKSERKRTLAIIDTAIDALLAARKYLNGCEVNAVSNALKDTNSTTLEMMAAVRKTVREGGTVADFNALGLREPANAGK